MGWHDASQLQVEPAPHPIAPHLGVVVSVQPATCVVQDCGTIAASGRKPAVTSGVEMALPGACDSPSMTAPSAWGGVVAPPSGELPEPDEEELLLQPVA